ncbi:MAG: S1 RNA-binding domain-containing protein [Chloroflexi bacterium]|nr:S1 RNA-binding domain-containing protein [Chloroflexota bacterium]
MSQEGQVYTGTITRLETFGAFVNIGAEREGLVHLSELSHGYINNPSEVVSVGDEVQVQVLGFSRRKRRIDLSVKALLEKPEQANTQAYEGNVQNFAAEIEDEEENEGDLPTAMEIALRQAMGNDMPTKRQRKQDKRRRNQERTHRQQDELLSRTLSSSNE